MISVPAPGLMVIVAFQSIFKVLELGLERVISHFPLGQTFVLLASKDLGLTPSVGGSVGVGTGTGIDAVGIVVGLNVRVGEEDTAPLLMT